MLNGAKRSEASPKGYRNLGKSRSCQHSGILKEILQRFALQNDRNLPTASRFRLSKDKTEPLYSKRQKKSYIWSRVDGSFDSA